MTPDKKIQEKWYSDFDSLRRKNPWIKSATEPINNSGYMKNHSVSKNWRVSISYFFVLILIVISVGKEHSTVRKTLKAGVRKTRLFEGSKCLIQISIRNRYRKVHSMANTYFSKPTPFGG